MSFCFIFRARHLSFLLASILLFFAATALAQEEASGARARPFCEDGIRISWNPAAEATRYRVVQIDEDGHERTVCSTSDSQCSLEGLAKDSSYSFYVDTEVDGQILLGDQRIGVKTYGDEDCVSRSAPAATATPKLSIDTCSHLPAGIVVRNFGTYTTQCKQVGAAGVGNAELIAQGLRDAVDIWNIIENDVLVCFRQPGALKFLDAATSPRAVMDLQAQMLDGLTCGVISGAGTVVLMESSEHSATAPATSLSPNALAPASIEPASDAAPETQPQLTFPDARPLVDCPVTTGDILNMRQGPGLSYPILREIPYQTRLTASQRAGEWYMVDYAGESGWIFFKLVSRHGSCNWA